jgi:hypothetical protein
MMILSWHRASSLPSIWAGAVNIQVEISHDKVVAYFPSGLADLTITVTSACACLDAVTDDTDFGIN